MDTDKMKNIAFSIQPSKTIYFINILIYDCNCTIIDKIICNCKNSMTVLNI